MPKKHLDAALQWYMLFFTCIKLMVHVLVCACASNGEDCDIFLIIMGLDILIITTLVPEGP